MGAGHPVGAPSPPASRPGSSGAVRARLSCPSPFLPFSFVAMENITRATVGAAIGAGEGLAIPSPRWQLGTRPGWRVAGAGETLGASAREGVALTCAWQPICSCCCSPARLCSPPEFGVSPSLCPAALAPRSHPPVLSGRLDPVLVLGGHGGPRHHTDTTMSSLQERYFLASRQSSVRWALLELASPLAPWLPR